MIRFNEVYQMDLCLTPVGSATDVAWAANMTHDMSGFKIQYVTDDGVISAERWIHLN